MAKMKRVKSVLAERIAAGKADPISDEERAIVSSMRAEYERKYGRPVTRPVQTMTKAAKTA